MPKRKQTVYSWDTTVFLAWINDEKDAPLGDIALVADEIDKNEAILVVSVLVVPEVFETKMTDQQKVLFNDFLKRSNVQLIDTTLPIAHKARAIRERGQADGRKIKTPDATIMATAIVKGCDVLHSLDDRGNGPLRLNGSSIVDGLRITKPIPISGQRGIR